MNERIKSLLAKAHLDVMEDLGNIDTNHVAEKFAQLIIKKCIDICLDRHHTWRWDNEPDSFSGPRDCAQSIKQHFGIEE
jgi:chemotaxis protein CheY-P-specific phosphatase CheC